jgi:nucleotide-binding universal stress UspA family protein
MAVISMHSAGYLTTLLSGNHESAIIDKANFPILVIPYQVRYSDYQTIAFATSMNYTDINLLQCLSGLAKHTDAEILIAHVAEEVSDAPQQEKDMKKFFNQIPAKITYPKINYRVIKSSNVASSIRSLTENREVDLLVLVHRRRNFFQKIFGGSITQSIANRPVKPLLIFPSSTVLEVLPVF